MTMIDAAFYRLVTVAGVSLAVFAIGTALIWFWRRPIERLRCIEATLIAVVAACLLQQFSLLPQISVGLLPPRTPAVAVPPRDVHSEIYDRPDPMPQVGFSRPALAEPAAHLKPVANLPAATQAPRIANGQISQNSGEAWAAVLRWTQCAILIVFFIGAGMSLLQLATGMLRLRRLLAGCAPAPEEIAGLIGEIQSPRRRSVSVLTSSSAEIPLTFGLRAPKIVLPESLIRSASTAEIRHCLAHEWSHIRNRDIAVWWAVQFLQPFVWFQPLFWYLRRELRLAQDQVADHFAAARAADPTAYAELLLNLAKRRSSVRPSLALTMNDGRSNLLRRIKLLLSPQQRLVAACRWWAVGPAAGILIVVAGASSMINIGRAATPAAADSPAASATSQPQLSNPATAKNSRTASNLAATTADCTMGQQLSDGSLQYCGEVLDHATKAPIAGAVVTIKREILDEPKETVLEETKHTTDQYGKYSFTISPKLANERLLYIKINVEHANFARVEGVGYALGMIRKNAKLGDPPFYARITLERAAPVTGRIVGPDGVPVAGVPMLAFSIATPGDFAEETGMSWSRTKSGMDGRFDLQLTKAGLGVFWIEPDKFAPMQVYVGEKRGDRGDMHLQPGVGFSGKVLDEGDKPVSGVWVTITDENSRSELGRLAVATYLTRSAKSGADGGFEMGPMKPGKYILKVESSPDDISHFSEHGAAKGLAVVFPRQSITVAAGMEEPVIVRAVPHVRFQAQYFDSKGKPCSGWEFWANGQLKNEWYSTTMYPDGHGRIDSILPHGLKSAEIELVSNEHSSLRFRIGKDKPLMNDRSIHLGTITGDVSGIEIIRYKAPILLIKPVDESGKPIRKAEVGALYQSGKVSDLSFGSEAVPSSIAFEKQPGGIWRSEQMLPGELMRVIAAANGYHSATEFVSLREAEIRSLPMVLKREPTETSTPAPNEKPTKK